MLRMLQDVLLYFQQFPTANRYSTRHERNKFPQKVTQRAALRR
jgi:hypothetical protein